MAIAFHHMAVLFVLIVTWFWMTKARLVDQRHFVEEPTVMKKLRSNKEAAKFFLTEEFVPQGVNIGAESSFRAPRKAMQPRATRMGDFELFTARGYGKRSSSYSCVVGTVCKKQLPFFGARRYGKRDPRDLSDTTEAKKMRRIFCLLTNCNNLRKPEPTMENLINFLQNKGKTSFNENETSLDD